MVLGGDGPTVDRAAVADSAAVRLEAVEDGVVVGE